MGGNTSKRRVVVEDDGGEEVVTISEAVVRRLRGQPDADTGTGGKSGPRTNYPSAHESSRFRESSKSTTSSQTPTYTPPPSPTVTPAEPVIATRIKNKDVEDFYIKKLKELQERNAALQKITNEQFANAVKEVESKFINVTASPVCQDLQAKVLECYQANPKQVLNCSGIVSAFTTCVDRARMSAYASRVQPVH